MKCMGEDVSYLKDYVYSKSQDLGIDPSIAMGIIEQESDWQNIDSEDGYGTGPTQMSWDTGTELGYSADDLRDPQKNIEAGLTYFKKLLDEYNGDYDAALQAYNEGDGAYNEGYRVPEYSEGVRTKSLNYQGYTSGSGGDTSLAYPSDEMNLDLSHPLQVEDGVEDYDLSHTDKALVQHANALNAWVYNTFGKEMAVSGGWRSPENNAAVNGSSTSQHLSGQALDIDLSNFSDEERQQILDKAMAMGFYQAQYHDAGTGYHLHLGAPLEGWTAIPQMEDYLPDRIANGDIWGIGAQASLVQLESDDDFARLAQYHSSAWQHDTSQGTPGAFEALWHGFTNGDNWVYNLVNALQADLFHSEHSINHWEASTEDIQKATDFLYGNKEEAERIASLSRDPTQFEYKLEQRKEWLDEQKKYSEYYEGLGLHTVGSIGAILLDPLNFIGGVGIGAKALTVAKALKIARNTEGAIQSAEQISKIVNLAVKVTENKAVTRALARSSRFIESALTPQTGVKGVVQSAVNYGLGGAVQNMVQDYLVSKTAHKDTHLADSALMGGLAGGALGILGRGVMGAIGKATQDTRSALSRVENGALREAVGLKNQYKVQQAQILSSVMDKEDTNFFSKFSKTMQELVNKNRVVVLGRKDAQAVARDSGFQLPSTAKAWYDPSTSATYLVREAVQDMNEPQLTGLLRHEIGVHQHLKDTIGEDNYNVLMNQIKQGAENDPTSVWAQAGKHVDSSDPEEILGYAIEHNMLNKEASRSLIDYMQSFLGTHGKKMSDKQILDYVAEAMTNSKLQDKGVAMFDNPDGSVTINGVKFSKENLANPNRLLDALEMAQANPNTRKSLKNNILDMMDGKGPLGKITMTNFGDVYHNPVRWIQKYAPDLWEDEQRRGLIPNTNGVHSIPSVERMASWFQSQLTPYIYKIGDIRNNWLADTYGKLSVYNPFHADSRRIPFNDAVVARYNKDFQGIEPTHIPDDLLNNKYVIEASKQLKAYRDTLLDLGKKSSDMFGLQDVGKNMIEKEWKPIDNEFYRIVDSDKMGAMYTHLLNQGDEGLRNFFVEYAKRFANRDALAHQIQRDTKLENLRQASDVEETLQKVQEQLKDMIEGDGAKVYKKKLKELQAKVKKYETKDIKEDDPNYEKVFKHYENAVTRINEYRKTWKNKRAKLTDKEKELKEQLATLKKEPALLEGQQLEDVVDERAKGWADRLMKEDEAQQFDNVGKNAQVGTVGSLKRRLPMNTSGEMKLPDGTVFSFDKNLRNTDLDYILSRNARRFAGEASLKNFLDNNALTLDSWSHNVREELKIAQGRTLSKAQVQRIQDGFDDMIKDLRGMSSAKDNYSQADVILKIFKNLAYSKNGAMMGINQLGDLATGVAHNGLGMVSSITRTTMNKMLSAKYGKQNMEELNNLSMMLEGMQVAGKVFSTGFRDRFTKEALSYVNGRGNQWLSKASDFSGNLTKITSKISQLGQLTDNQVQYATAQAIADSAQWAWGRKFSPLRNPFSKAKLRELGVSNSKLISLQADIKEYLGWNGKKDTDFVGDRIDEWRDKHPETFWLFRDLIHNQVSRSVLLDSRGNAGKLTQNNMLMSALFMFKGFSFRASNARFARMLRTKDVDDALAFAYSLVLETSIYAARQASKIAALYALGQTDEAKRLRENYLNDKALARAAIFRPAFMSPFSTINDMYEAASGTPTIRTTVSNANRTNTPQSAGDVVGNFVAQSPVMSTIDEMTFKPVTSAIRLLEGEGTKGDVTKLLHGVLPIPNVIGLTQAIDTLAKTTVGSKLPDKKKPQRKKPTKATEPKEPSIIDKLFGD